MVKGMNSLSNPAYRTIIGAAPSYISTLLANNWIKCEVESEGPAIAWTEWDDSSKCFRVHFLESVASLSGEAMRTLWRHEVGHIVFRHFSKEMCDPDNLQRSMNEALVASDIQVNTYLDNKPIMDEIGQLALAHSGVTDRQTGGYVDPEEWLPKIGLKVHEYPYDVIHTYLHKFVDETENHPAGGMCGGITGPENEEDTLAALNATVVAAVSGNSNGDGSTDGGESWGSTPGNMRISIPNSPPLPDWIGAVESFARSIVEIVLAERRKHSRPNEMYRSVGIHVPTYRPSWAYKPSQVCFLVDTSGSMVSDLKYVSPVVEYLARHNIETRLITGDTHITFDGVVTSIPEIIGGGGTDITPLFDRARTYEPESIICFTDGYVPAWPKDDGIPTLWVGCKEKVPYGIKA